MKIIPEVDAGKGVFGFLVTNVDETEQLFGETLAHELLHVLNLDHRGILGDGLNLDPKNLMRVPYRSKDTAEDIDLIQLRATRYSPLLTEPK